MQLGWIDFSKEEREKVLDVINLLSEDGAVDELGIGIIRDSFANIFFPGTSTVQTRAKYFFIVPYVLKEVEDGKYGNNIDTILKKINEEEKQCAIKMLESDKNGVIGARSLPNKWVARKPSNIYWNGIRTFKLFTNDSISISEYIKLACSLKNQKKIIKLGNHNDEAEENEKDDKDAGDIFKFNFWNLPDVFKTDWRANLKIHLLPEEAYFLRKQIINEIPDSLFAYLLKNNIDANKYVSFAALYEDIKDDVSDKLRLDMRMAVEFGRFIQMAFVQYNLIISAENNTRAIDLWDELKGNISTYSSLDLNSIYIRFGITNYRLKSFLNSLKETLLEENIVKVREIIKNRENDLKGKARAKVNRIGEFDENAWIGMISLDYRFSGAKRIINDIYEGEAM